MNRSTPLALLAAVLSAACAAAAENGAAPALVVPFDFARAPEEGRAFADMPLPPAPEGAAAVELVFEAPVPPGPVRALTVHLHSGDGWHSADLSVSRARGSVRIPFSSFAPEGDPGPASSADTLRLSLWASAVGGIGSVSLTSARLVSSAPVAIAGTGPLADRCDRLLDRIDIAHDRIGADVPRDALADLRVLFLPDASTLSGSETTRLRAFVRRGGRLFVFYSSDSALAAAVGVRAGAWEPSRAEWPGFVLDPSGRRVPHPTGNRICPEPGPKARTVAFWLEPDGRPGKRPAVVLGPGGAWFAHVPPRAYPAACDLVSSLLSELAPDLAPPPRAEQPAEPPVAPPPGFLVGAWASAPPKGPLPEPLRALFVRIPDGAPFPKPADADAPALHVWMPCLMNDDGSWRDPAALAVRKAAAAEAVRLVRAGAAGVHLDYVRSAAGIPATPERTAAVTELVRTVSAAVRAERPDAVVSAAVFPTPSDAASVNQDWPAWVKEGLVDFVSPMIYDDDPDTFRARLDACLAAAPAAALLPGIGTGADESQTDLPATRAELAAAIGAGCRGAAFFALDDALLELLPSLFAEATGTQR